jgi:hypothetical protein
MPVRMTRPRSRSKPDAIFIHPRDSNIARADALFAYGKEAADRPAESAWQEGTGRNAARALLAAPDAGAPRKAAGRHPPSKTAVQDPERRPLYDSASDSSDGDSSD